MNSENRDTEGLWAFVLSALLLIAVTIWFALQVNQMTDATHQQEALWTRAQLLEQVIDVLQDAETGQRGYLLTGDDSFLEPYRAARGQFTQKISQVRALPGLDAEFLLGLQTLEQAGALKFDDLQASISLRMKGDAPSALAMVSAEEGKRQMSVLRRTLDDLLAQSKSRGDRLNAATAERLRQLNLLLIATTFLVIVTVGIGVFQIRRFARTKQTLAHRLELEATHDVLTSLPNRRFLMRWLQALQAHSLRDHAGLALLFIDLDGFKRVNDRFGHDVGDTVLKSAAQALRAASRTADFGARLGGDEFVIVVSGDLTRAGLSTMANRIQQGLAELQLPGGEKGLSASIGIGLTSDVELPGISIDDLMTVADKAMYAAKQQGGKRYVFAESLQTASEPLPAAMRTGNWSV
jgi:diguanylate cyclase (GGDEF)-like protein